MSKPKVIVTLEGGLIQEVIADTDVDVYSVDYDANDEDGIMIPKPIGDEARQAWVDKHGVIVDPERAEGYANLIQEENERGQEVRDRRYIEIDLKLKANLAELREQRDYLRNEAENRRGDEAEILQGIVNLLDSAIDQMEIEIPF